MQMSVMLCSHLIDNKTILYSILFITAQFSDLTQALE